MKKKIILFTIIFILVFYSVSIFLIKNYMNNKCESIENENICQKVKHDFIDEYNSNESYNLYTIVGQYKNGYILIKVEIPARLDLNFNVKSVTIDDVTVNYFPYTTFFYFEKGVIIVFQTVFENIQKFQKK